MNQAQDISNNPIDYYLAKQKVFDIRIRETEKYIAWMKNRTGLARYKCKEKIVEANKLLAMLKAMKEDDCLPWEPGKTYDIDVTGITL